MRLVACIITVGLLAAACTGGDDSVDPSTITFPDPVPTTAVAPTSAPVAISTTSTDAPVVIPQGGVVRVGVWGEVDPDADTLTGEMLRSLTQPQLFTPMPDGSWEPSLVEPGTDADSADFRSATFRLRSGAVWSDGTNITGGDLWSSADRRFVDEIHVADDGLYTVSFNQPLPQWRRLWSGADVVRPEIAGKYGGPWRIQDVNPDLEAVLVPNEAYWGPQPHLDELRLVVVPDQGVMIDLFEDGFLDVVAPVAATGRLQTMEALAPGRVASGAVGAWWVGVVIDPDDVSLDDRVAFMSAYDAEFFVGALLKGEAVVAESLGGTPAPLPPGDPAAVADLITITSPDDVAMLGAARRAILLSVRDAGGRVPELRDATSDLAEGWIRGGDYEAHLALHYDPPGGPCWTCRFADVDEEAMRIADGGGGPPDQLLADEAVLQVLWRPVPVVAWSERVNGVVANGWAVSAAWNAHEWWVSG